MFLKGEKKLGSPGGEIEEYANIEIEWKRGKHAVMTIYDDEDKELEEIKLYQLKTREEMHKLMTDKGFTKKTKAQKVTEIQLDKMNNAGSSVISLQSMFFMVFGTIAGVFYFVFAKQQRNRTRRVARA